jgi:hypothetical protein
MLFTVLADNTSMFQQTGMTMFKALATAMIVMAGVKIALGGDPGYRKFANYIMLISICFVLITYYTTPVGLFGGQSFATMIPKSAYSWADTINTSTQKELTTTLQTFINDINQNTTTLNPITAIREVIVYVVIVILVGLLELAMFIVIGFGYVALGVVMLVGPLLVPWIIVPKMDFLFWSWFKTLIKFSFYPLIANAFLFLIAKIMLLVFTCGSFNLNSYAVQDAAYREAQLPILICVFAAGIFGCFKIPSLVSDIFSGASSSGSAQAMESAVRGAVSAAVL